MDRDGSSSQLLQLPTQKHRRPSLVTLLEQLIADVTTSSCANNDNDDDVNNDNDNNSDDDDNDDDNDDNEVDVDGDTGSDQADDDAILTNYTRRRQQRLAVIEALLRKDYLPVQQHTTIDDLVEDFDTKLQEDVHEMITDQDGDNYSGLNSNYNTHDEVETILRIFPDLIKKRKKTKWDFISDVWVDVDNDDEGDYPIQCLTIRRVMQDDQGLEVFNLMATPFVHLFAQLAIEFHSFDADERGGLMVKDKDGRNSIYNLAHFQYSYKLETEDYYCMDKIRTNEYNRLREIGLMCIDDITGNNLLPLICCHRIFPGKSARFLIEWCPACLLESGRYGEPLYTIAKKYGTIDGSKYLPAFQFLFEQCIRYYPYKKGISHLFQNVGTVYVNTTHERITPLAMACSPPLHLLKRDPVKRKAIMDVVEDVLSRYSGTTPINTMDAILAAAMDPEIHVDGVYFLTRRQPDVLISMIKSSQMNSSSINNNDHATHGQDTKNNNNDNSSDGDNGNTIKNGHATNNDVGDNDSEPTTTNIGKRKRNNY